MAHPFFIWTKTYDLNHIEGKFNIFVSADKLGHFYSVLLYYVSE